MPVSSSTITLSAITKIVSPILKDIYDKSKKEIRKSLKIWEIENSHSKISRKLNSINKVRTILHPNKDVGLDSFYSPSHILINGQRKIINSISDLGRGNHIIEGIVGQGKSMFARHLALQEIKNNNPRIPVFLELRKINNKQNLKDLIFTYFSSVNIEINDDVFSYLCQTGKFILILDGFDEINSSLTPTITNEIETISEQNPDLLIIVTSRPSNEIQKIANFNLAQIDRIAKNEFSKFISKLNVSSVKSSDIVHSINSSPSKISELINTPLMLTLVVLVYQAEKKIPSDLPEFFEKLFYTVFTKHDSLKANFDREHYSGLSERKLQNLFEAFCFMQYAIWKWKNFKSKRIWRLFRSLPNLCKECRVQRKRF